MAQAWQFQPTTVEQLKELVLPSGNVTVQEANEFNRIDARCYVGTAWGTSILSYGDWIVLFDVGIVQTFTDAQFRYLFQEGAAIPEPEREAPEEKSEHTLSWEPPQPEFALIPAPLSKSDKKLVGAKMTQRAQAAVVAEPEEQLPGEIPVVRVDLWNPPERQAFMDYLVQHRLDYVLNEYRDDESGKYMAGIVMNATGAEIAKIAEGDTVVGYADGRLEVEQR